MMPRIMKQQCPLLLKDYSVIVKEKIVQLDFLVEL